MSNNKVTNVADPTANGDAVNKKYVDDKATETETTLKEYVDGHSGGFENAVIVGLYDMTKTRSIPREANNDYLFIILPTFSTNYPGSITGTIRNGSNDGQGHGIVASAGQFTFSGDAYVMVYRVAVTPQPVDPATKFNQIDLRNYVGGLSGSTVNTASNFKAALQYILDNNPGKHFYYGTDYAGTTWYFASDTELSALSNDSYTCGNGVQKDGTEVKETFKMNKYVEPGPSYDYGEEEFNKIPINTDTITTVGWADFSGLGKINEQFSTYAEAFNRFYELAIQAGFNGSDPTEACSRGVRLPDNIVTSTGMSGAYDPTNPSGTNWEVEPNVIGNNQGGDPHYGSGILLFKQKNTSAPGGDEGKMYVVMTYVR